MKFLISSAVILDDYSISERGEITQGLTSLAKDHFTDVGKIVGSISHWVETQRYKGTNPLKGLFCLTTVPLVDLSFRQPGVSTPGGRDGESS